MSAVPRSGWGHLGRWLTLPTGQAACIAHLGSLALTLSIAKVLLATVAVTLFLTQEGPQRLPLFYVLFAALAIALSFALGAIVERAPKIGLAQAVFAGTLIGAAALRLAIALDIPGTYFLLLASAHVYEIVVDIVFWVVVAAFLDAVDFRRATPLIYMAIALGGALGGGLARGLAEVVSAADMLWALPVLAACVVAQLALAGRRLQALPDHLARASPIDERASLARLARLLARYPLALLIALNALVLTVLYGLSEYLVFTIYSAHFRDEGEMTRFLAVVFAGLQVVELALLYAVSRPLLLRAGPLARNLVFPITSFASLLYLVLSQKLPAAIVTHLNAEAISNAVFQPVNNANYAPLPLRFQGRARTLADGIFYPAGLALAGGLLMVMAEAATLEGIGFIALLFALLFGLLNVGVGLLFLPTLLTNLRAGVVHFSELPQGPERASAGLQTRVRELLHSRDGALRSLGLALARRLDPADVLEDLQALAPGADRATRHALAAVLARAPPARFDELLGHADSAARLTALEVKLARREALPAERGRVLVTGGCASVRALALLAAGEAGDPLPTVAELARDPEVAADVVEAVVGADRDDLAAAVAAALPAAPAACQCRALGWLRAKGKARLAAPLARRLAAHRDPAVRAEAIACLGAGASSTSDLEALVDCLEDPSRRVRRSVAETLAAQGDRVTDLLGERLSGPGASAAAAALMRIGSRRARTLLATLLERVEAEVAAGAGWLARLPRLQGRVAWVPLELAIADHQGRALDLVLGLLAAGGEERRVDQLRRALGAQDQRTRASALEALASWPDRRPALAALRILERMGVGREAPPLDARGADEILGAASAFADPWIQAAARSTARALAPATASEKATDMATIPGERDLERALALKRTPLFRYLPLDTLLAVARMLESRRHLAGEEIVAEAAHQDWLGIVESGSVLLVGRHGGERVGAPGTFGELALVDELPPYPRVVAAEEVALLRLHRVIFEDLCRDHPEIVLELCRLLARRLRAAHGGSPREAVAKSGSEW